MSETESRPIPRTKRSIIGRLFRLILLLFITGCIGLAALGYWGWGKGQEPGAHQSEILVVIPRGSGLRDIAQKLHDSGAIENELLFTAWARIAGRFGGLKAGEYAIPAHSSIQDIIRLLRDGKTVVRRLIIPEGLTSQEIIAILNAADGMNGNVSTIPSEGSLLPETYFYSYGDSRGQILDRMRAAMDEALQAAWVKRADNLPYDNVHQALTLASIVEKETGRPDERSRIAGVFVNRLRLGMPLQSDPTVIYALTQGQTKLSRLLTRNDLRVESPFNTYLNSGLPPGPISNPGRAAIEAVMRPLASKELYFVADGTGGHAFAETLEQHNHNVARWRQLQRNDRQDVQ